MDVETSAPNVSLDARETREKGADGRDMIAELLGRDVREARDGRPI